MREAETEALLDALRADPRYTGEGAGAYADDKPFVWIKFRNRGAVEANTLSDLARKAAAIYDVRV